MREPIWGTKFVMVPHTHTYDAFTGSYTKAETYYLSKSHVVGHISKHVVLQNILYTYSQAVIFRPERRAEQAKRI